MSGDLATEPLSSLPSPSALILDRDGVINRELGRGVLQWADFALLPGVLEALARLNAFPGPILVASNQSAIGRGWTTRKAVDAIHERLLGAVADAGGRIDGIFICPHAPGDGCACRKPRPGLLQQAAQRHGFDLRLAWVVGDTFRDVEAALAVGARPILVRSGKPVTVELESQLLQLRVTILDHLAAVAQLLRQALMPM